MSKAFVFFFFLISFLFVSDLSVAQEKDSVAMYVRTRDGKEYQGFLEVQNSREIILRTRNHGTITIPLASVKALREIKPEHVDNAFLLTSAYFSRYYVSSSAITLRKNEGYYNNSMLVFNRAEYGLADFWTVGVETFFMSGYSVGLTNRLRVPLNSEFFHLGAKGTLGVSFHDGSMVGQAMGLVTIGPVDRNITLGIGYSFIYGMPTNNPSYQVSGDFRVGRRGAILFDFNVTETAENRLGYFIIGGRHRFRRVGLDYGFSLIADYNITPYVLPLPWLGLTVPF